MLNKEYGVTSQATATCEFCGKEGTKQEMARAFSDDKESHWVHDSCVLEEIAKRKESAGE